MTSMEIVAACLGVALITALGVFVWKIAHP